MTSKQLPYKAVHDTDIQTQHHNIFLELKYTESASVWLTP